MREAFWLETPTVFRLVGPSAFRSSTPQSVIVTRVFGSPSFDAASVSISLRPNTYMCLPSRATSSWALGAPEHRQPVRPADLPEDDVAPIEVRGAREGDEELRVVGVAAGIGHREHARPGVLEQEVLVLK